MREVLGRIRLRRDRELIVQSGIFDSEWYLATNPDVAATRTDPLDHFMWIGAAEGRDPNPMFDTRWYRAINPDVAAAGWNPLVHYLRYGAAEGRQPHPMFDVRRRLEATAGQGVPGPADNPLSRYLRARKGRRVARSAHATRPSTVQGSDALARLRQSAPSEFDALVARLRRAGMFDEDFYRALRGDVTPDEDALEHFLLKGEREGALPYAGYAQPRVVAGLLGRQLPVEGSIYATFVDAQLAASQDRVGHDRRAGRPSWATPGEMTVVASGGSSDRIYRAIAEPSDRPVLRWKLDPNTAFVIPFVAPEASLRSLSLPVDGSGISDRHIYFTIAKSPDGAGAVDGVVRHGSDTRRLVCELTGELEKGRRYFLRFACAEATGLELSATEFYPVPLVAPRDPPATGSQSSAKAAAEPSILAKVTASTLGILRSDPKRAAVQERATDDRLFHVAIVTILYRKADHVASFLEAIFRQTYSGPITVVFVDDGSPDAAFADIEQRIEQAASHKPANVAVRIVRNGQNLGNCLSRNAGIAAVDADIYVVIDADCLINRDFVSAHVAEHRLPGTSAVVGPYNIETNGQDGFRLLQRLENDPEPVTAYANMQDELLPYAFVNTVTRNFSIGKAWLDAHGAFDPMLSYSAKPDSGYGWEDVDIGARIYASGGHVRYTRDAFSIHMSHASSLPQSAQVRGSAKNFRYLIEKHPFMRNVCRRWYVDTADRIVEWAENVDASSADIADLKADIETRRPAVAPLLPYLRKKRPRYRVLTHRWHVPHQFEIYKLPFDFTLVTGTGTGATNSWSYDQRPLPENAQLVSIADVDPSQFDMALVHFDENVLSPDLSNGVLGTEWGDTFRWFTENIKIPMVGVCHGTVPFVGQYAANPNPIAEFETYRPDADMLRDRLADVNVVVNSHQAADEWQFRKSRVIWHGYDPQEFLPGKHDLDIVTHGVDKARPHYRGAHALRATLDRLGAGIGVSTHKHEAQMPVSREDPRYAGFAFQNWLDHLGRHKIYLNTTLRSPMPRSRTEAMLCGVIPVSLDNHDVSRFIENGVNGFYSSSPEELADFCRSICRNPAMHSKMSASARATAMDVFNHDRFLTQWVRLVEETIG